LRSSAQAASDARAGRSLGTSSERRQAHRGFRAQLPNRTQNDESDVARTAQILVTPMVAREEIA
jgi:hypothetical protein